MAKALLPAWDTGCEPPHRARQLSDRFTYGDHFLRPRLQGPDVPVQASSGGERKHRAIGLELTKLFDQFDVVLVGHVDTDDCQANLVVVRFGQDPIGFGNRSGLDATEARLPLEQKREAFAKKGIVMEE
jgi:hypothetical protein